MAEASGPTFSIVIAAYNSEATLPATLDSLLAQSNRDWEAIIVDDGSSDRTLEVARSAVTEDTRMRVVSQSNSGTAAARNCGAAEASGEWLLFLDSDDYLNHDYLERMSRFMRDNPGYDIYSCNVDLLLADGRMRPLWRGRRFARPFSLTAVDQIRESSIVLMSPVRASLWRSLGGFRSHHAEDYDLWLRALLAGARHLYDPETLAVYRRRAQSKTRSLVQEADSFLRILEEHAARPGLSVEVRDAFAEAVPLARARIARRRLEEDLLAGRHVSARIRYWQCRRAFPHAAKYWAGLAVMLVSPRLYARWKSARMV
jgi:glycosyltransferase involved in cell wall biosynthesis